MDSYEFHETIAVIGVKLTKPQRDYFDQCLDSIQRGKYRSLRGSDDALSAVMQDDQFCRECKKIKDQQIISKIEECIQFMIDNS
ncbi:hypothetical protein VF14_27805 [Nostoc linckia z18]|jgi:hypothetical protein|uniref:Uncharacterized protein n=2 Tax=Nostoc linckia TaxID=92942 RepID=A0A9Q5ZBZ3_NOSLI|nr:hypothetical protein [Nostoc linckia]PHK39410.1 hypothetical protein VF12_14505 [Nostoc linckia z15]PHK43435.1 hypothetical protein VF13_27080 [Nostoc linckia z16]PHJ66968.1 hypothetical protein VF02_06540 [Nostoc linckia z1]PHJ67698.1 hypothetical protein VF05_16865 [Nostoc linckia z3]PHJ77230.1 hypothetical protein VF03_05100 [Nostoc linckia z2]